MQQADLINVIKAMIKAMQDARPELTKLDTAIGDGDHGINMARAFLEVEKKLPELEDKALADIVRQTGMTLAFKVGGASGPLYGTAFMDASNVLKDKEEISVNDLSEMLDLGIKGIQKRGKAERGEKTMLDTLFPAKDALDDAIAADKPADEALDQMLESAKEGMEATIPMLATKGRASYLGERSIGHQDPGATSSYYLLRAIVDTAKGD